MRRSSVLLAAGTLALAGCADAPPAPLDPAASAARLEARTLADDQVTAAESRAGIASGPWTLDRLTVAAWTLRPDISVIRADVAAAEAAIRTAGEIPNPTFSLDPSYLYDNASGNLSPWTWAASLGFTFELGDKRAIRTAQSKAEADAKRWQLAEALWKARSDVRKAWIARALAQRSVDLAGRELALRQTFATWTENAVRFGAQAQPERLAAVTGLAQAQAAARTARGEQTAADAALAVAVGVTTAHMPFADMAAPDAALPEPAKDLDALRARALVNRLSVRRALAEYSVTEQAVRAAVAKQYPDLNFGPGYIYDKGDKGVTLTLGFTLPLFHGAQAAIDEALAARAKSAAQFESEQAQALGDMESAARKYEAAYAAWQEAKDAEDAATRANTGVQQRLAQGFADRGDVVTAGLAQTAAERATLDAARAALDALSALEDGLQQPLWPASNLIVEQPLTAAR